MSFGSSMIRPVRVNMSQGSCSTGGRVRGGGHASGSGQGLVVRTHIRLSVA